MGKVAWWQRGVVYQIYPWSFADSNGDGIGDLPVIMRLLDHISCLGVDCIWLSPMKQSTQKDMFYYFYDYN